MRRKTIKCPYCGAQATLRHASVVHGERARDEYLWVCDRFPACDSYVGAHRRDNSPLGTLADKNLRQKRIAAHRVFNRLWESGLMQKGSAYIWLQSKFALNSSQAHIAMFSERMCDEVIAACCLALRNNNMAA